MKPDELIDHGQCPIPGCLRPAAKPDVLCYGHLTEKSVIGSGPAFMGNLSGKLINCPACSYTTDEPDVRTGLCVRCWRAWRFNR